MSESQLSEGSAEISVNLDKLPHEHYLPGHQVKCKVILKVQESVRVQSIFVQYKGRAKTFWFNNPQTLEPEDFSDHEQYFSSFQYIYGVQNGPEKLIKPGFYAFDCLYKLPTYLPSSMTHPLGKVVYSVIVQVQTRSEGIKQKEVKRDFKVSSRLDLNEYPNLKYKVENLTTEIYGCECLCCMCCKTRVIDMVTVIPCSGYVPGENIPIFIEIDNKSKLNIDEVMCELYELSTFTARAPDKHSKRQKRELWNHKFNGVPSHENRFFQTNLYLSSEYNFKVLYGCNIIDVKYFLKTTGSISEAKSITNEIELMIGTEPFSDSDDLKLEKNEVMSPLKRVIPGSFVIAGTSRPETYREMSEKDPLLPKKC